MLGSSLIRSNDESRIGLAAVSLLFFFLSCGLWTAPEGAARAPAQPPVGLLGPSRVCVSLSLSLALDVVKLACRLIIRDCAVEIARDRLALSAYGT